MKLAHPSTLVMGSKDDVPSAENVQVLVRVKQHIRISLVYINIKIAENVQVLVRVKQHIRISLVYINIKIVVFMGGVPEHIHFPYTQDPKRQGFVVGQYTLSVQLRDAIGRRI